MHTNTPSFNSFFENVDQRWASDFQNHRKTGPPSFWNILFFADMGILGSSKMINHLHPPLTFIYADPQLFWNKVIDHKSVASCLLIRRIERLSEAEIWQFEVNETFEASAQHQMTDVSYEAVLELQLFLLDCFPCLAVDDIHSLPPYHIKDIQSAEGNQYLELAHGKSCGCFSLSNITSLYLYQETTLPFS